MPIQLAAVHRGGKIGFETGPDGILPGRPTLVMVHGAGGRRLSWRRQLQGLGGDFNMVALELPGHGETPGPAEKTITGLAAWVSEVLAAWALPSPVVLAGHSMGGAIAQEAALVHPDTANALVLIATGAQLGVNPAVFGGLKADFKSTVEMIVKWSMDKSADPDLLKEAVSIMSENSAELLAADFEACNTFDRRNDVSRIGLPVLVVCGQNDKMTRPELSRHLAETIPGASLTLVESAGHMVMEEKPEETNRAISDFIKRLA